MWRRMLFGALVVTVCPFHNAMAKGKGMPNHNLLEIGILPVPGFHSDVTNFPLALRSVPLHPDDGRLAGYGSATDPLPNTTLFLPFAKRTQVYLLFYPTQYTGLGVSYAGGDDSHPGADSPQRYQQNQFGTSERGYGMSLRWFETDQSGSTLGLAGALTTGWYMPKTWKYWVGFRPKVGGVYQLKGRKALMRSGYDRWSADQNWQTLTLGEVYQHTVYGGLEIGIFGGRDEGQTVPHGVALQVFWCHDETIYRGKERDAVFAFYPPRTDRFQLAMSLIY